MAQDHGWVTEMLPTGTGAKLVPWPSWEGGCGQLHAWLTLAAGTVPIISLWPEFICLGVGGVKKCHQRLPEMPFLPGQWTWQSPGLHGVGLRRPQLLVCRTGMAAATFWVSLRS